MKWYLRNGTYEAAPNVASHAESEVPDWLVNGMSTWSPQSISDPLMVYHSCASTTSFGSTDQTLHINDEFDITAQALSINDEFGSTDQTLHINDEFGITAQTPRRNGQCRSWKMWQSKADGLSNAQHECR